MTLTRTRLLGVAIGTTWVVAWLPIVGMFAYGASFAGAAGRALVVFQSFAPLVGALVAQTMLPRREGLADSLGLTVDINRFWLIAWLAPIATVVLAIAIAWLAFDVDPVLTAADLLRNKRSLVSADALATFDRLARETPMQPPWKLVLMAMPAGLTLHFVPALAAEVGLRGFFYREMPGTFFPRSLSIGLVHGLMSAPVAMLGVGFPDHALAGAALVVLNAMLFGMAALYLRARANSAVPVALFHGTWLALAHPAIDLTFGAADWVRPTGGVSASIALALLVAAFAAHDRYSARAKLMFPAPTTRV